MSTFRRILRMRSPMKRRYISTRLNGVTFHVTVIFNMKYYFAYINLIKKPSVLNFIQFIYLSLNIIQKYRSATNKQALCYTVATECEVLQHLVTFPVKAPRFSIESSLDGRIRSRTREQRTHIQNRFFLFAGLNKPLTSDYKQVLDFVLVH